MKRFISSVAFFLLTTVATPIALAGFSIIPADPNIRQFSFELKPGENKQSSVIIDNLSDVETTVNLYGADGTQSNLGTFALTTSGTEQRHIGKWVNFANNNIKIEPRGRKEIPFIVRVPADATPGTYSGGIAAEAATPVKGKPASGSAVSTTSRVAVKLYVSVAGEKIHKIDWQDFSFTPGQNGNMGSFNLGYENMGNTVVVTEQKIEISGPFGIGKEEIKLPTATILQGKKVELSDKWDNEPFFGFVTAKAVITFSEYNIITNGKMDPRVQTRELSIFIPLKIGTLEGKITVGVLLILLLLATAAIMMLIKRRQFFKTSRAYTVREGDTLTELASGNNINWKKLAKFNKLKAPYNLKTGQKILLPGTKK